MDRASNLPQPLFTKEGNQINAYLRSQVKKNKVKNPEKTTALFASLNFLIATKCSGGPMCPPERYTHIKIEQYL
ncbi:hypothetical protein C3364_03730 [Avibacterium paragallinarum]|nr:hypothetical protein C3364_03730 [Avibacterium paragallinarum]